MTKTHFASAQRLSDAEINKQKEMFADSSERYAILDAMLDITLILNSDRQVIFANEALKKYLNLDELTSVYGLRPGEILDCMHAFETDGGCGTSKFCSTCGAVRAILTSQGGNADIQECRITTRTKQSLDLKVYAVPIVIKDEKYTIFTIADISNEKRRKALERIFFHDILNTAGGIKGITEIINDVNQLEREELDTILAQLSDRLIDEIKAQQELLLAEQGELKLQYQEVSALLVVDHLVEMYRLHPLCRGKKIILSKGTTDVTFTSDDRLLSRVIGNMMKNALEATPEEGLISLKVVQKLNHVCFIVHNNGVITKVSQLQIFQRSFSTKGVNRGLGTYSIKLLTEKYLNGRAGFISTEELGTSFYAIFPIGNVPGKNLN